MPTSEFVLSRVEEFIDREGEQLTVSSRSVTSNDTTQKTTEVFLDEVITAFVTGPKKNFLGNVQNEEADLMVYVKGGTLSFNPKKDDRVLIDSDVYQVIDSESYRIRGEVVILAIAIKR